MRTVARLFLCISATLCRMAKSLPVRPAEPAPNWITATCWLPRDDVAGGGTAGCCTAGADGAAIAAIWAVARSADDPPGWAAGTGGDTEDPGGAQPGGGTKALLGSAVRVGAAGAGIGAGGDVGVAIGAGAGGGGDTIVVTGGAGGGAGGTAGVASAAATVGALCPGGTQPGGGTNALLRSTGRAGVATGGGAGAVGATGGGAAATGAGGGAAGVGGGVAATGAGGGAAGAGGEDAAAAVATTASA